MLNVESGNSSRTFTLMLVIAAVAVIYLAQAVLIPLALALLLTFLLAPLVVRLERLGLSRVPSVTLVIAISFLVISVTAWLVVEQAVDVAQNLGQYRTNILDKLDSVQESGGSWKKLRDLAVEFSQRIADPHQQRSATETDAESKAGFDPVPKETANEPVRVAIVQDASSTWTALSAWLPSVFGSLATGGVVIVFAVFMLIEREDLRNRLIRLIGSDQISITTQAMDDAARRVSKYLRAQLIVNATYGLTLALGLFVIGIPNSLLWGLLAGLLRYVPYLGPVAAGICPVVLSLAVFSGWTMPLITLSLFVVLELISNNVMEPLMYRSSTGISTVGILVAAVFWTWLWGAIGLVLATPLTVCIAVMGRYVRPLEFLSILLSDEQVLAPSEHFYQRLLAGDQTEAESLIEQRLAAGTLDEVFDEVLMPTLALVEQDRARGSIDEVKHRFILETVRDFIEELVERLPQQASSTDGDPPAAGAPTPTVTPHSERAVVCLPARNLADELAGDMLSQLLSRHEHQAQSMSVKALASEMLDEVEQQKVGMVCVSALPPLASSHARYLCKRLRARFPNMKIVLGLWEVGEIDAKAERRLRASGADKIVTSLKQAIKEI